MAIDGPAVAKRVRLGMSSPEVIRIAGKPDSHDSVGSLEQLVYSDARVPGASIVFAFKDGLLINMLRVFPDKKGDEASEWIPIGAGNVDLPKEPGG